MQKQRRSIMVCNGKKIVWPLYSKKGKKLKDGSIDGVKMSVIWKRCQREAKKICSKFKLTLDA